MSEKQRYSAQEVVDALIATAGIKTAAARHLGCHHDTITNYINRYPTVAAAYQQARDSIIDKAESVLVQRLNAREWDAAKFVLTTLGRDRGWGQQVGVSHSGPDGGPVKITTIVVEKPADDSDG